MNNLNLKCDIRVAIRYKYTTCFTAIKL